ncbi:MAG: vitamin K epoxide reductase family protein [Chitinophagaceae bacterium]|jgi:uncharacterized membrane protein
MHNQVLNILLKWLSNSGYSFDKSKLETLFLSHPDSGDIVSISDTLNDLNIENSVAEIPKESLIKLKDPFLAVVANGSQNSLVLAQLLNNEKLIVDTGNNNSITVTLKEFTDKWNGLVIIIDKKYKKSFRLTPNKFLPLLLAATIVSLFILLNINSLNIFLATHFVTSIIGILISTLIIVHELGFNLTILSKVCNLNTNTSCSAVLTSKTAKIYKNIGLSDLCILFFSAQLLFSFSSSSLYLKPNNLIFSISLFVLPISLYSIYVQKFIVKKWCPLCLAIIGVLLLQSIIATIYFFNNDTSFGINAQSFLSYFLVALIVVSFWFFLKPFLYRAAKYKTLNINELSFRRNYHLFIPFYSNQIAHNMEMEDLQDFTVGNSKASLNITAILSPNCQICGYTNEILNNLIKVHSDTISVNYRLLANPNQLESKKTKAAIYLLSQIIKQRNPREVLTKWYNNKITENLYKHITNSDEYETELKHLKNNENWCIQNGINYSPAIFINGKLFPNWYDKADLNYFIEEIIHYEMEAKEHDVKIASQTMVLVDNT